MYAWWGWLIVAAVIAAMAAWCVFLSRVHFRDPPGKPTGRRRDT